MISRLSRILPRTPLKTPSRRFNAFMLIPRDVQEFLDGYPDNVNDASCTANLDFYRNETRCRPDRMLISEIYEQYVFDLCQKPCY